MNQMICRQRLSKTAHWEITHWNSKTAHSNWKGLQPSWKIYNPAMGKTITRSKGNTTWSKSSTTRSIHKPKVSGGYQGPGVEGRGDESRCCHGDQSHRMMCWPEVLASQWERRGRLTVFARNTEQLLTQLKLWPRKKYWQMLRPHKCWKAQWLSQFTTIKWLHTVSWMFVLFSPGAHFVIKHLPILE